MTVIRVRRDDSADWALANPILDQGEPALDLDSMVLKIGDGITPWNELGPALGGQATVTYLDHGAVSGSVAFASTIETHVLTLTGDTDITLTGGENGRTIQVFGTGDFIMTLEGQIVPTRRALAVKIRDAWIIYTVAGVGDSLAPAAGVLSVNATDTEATLTVAGASDLGVGLHPTPYSFSTNGGTTWSPWQASSTYLLTGLTPSTPYDFQHRVRDAVGNLANGVIVTQSTIATLTWVDRAVWTFTRADATELNGLAPDTGSGVSLAAPATNTGATPPIIVRTLTNRANLKGSGGTLDLLLTKTTAETFGLAVEGDWVLGAGAQSQFGSYDVGTNSNGTNYVGFAISPTGVVTADHFAAGSTTYTAEPGAPTTIAKTATIRAEFRPGSGNNGCTGKLYADGTLIGRISSTGWTWVGKHIIIKVLSNQLDSYVDNLEIKGLA